jgi:hypothetical protein
MPLAFSGRSENLKATEVVATLGTPILKDRNAVWCASFQTAWKALQTLVDEPLSFGDTNSTAQSLNAEPDLVSQMPENCLYIIVATNQVGVLDQIRRDFKRKFPQTPEPIFPLIAPESVLTYAHLETKQEFPLAYHQNPTPLHFTDVTQKQVDLSSFGILPQDHDACAKLRAQVRVLFRDFDMRHVDAEFGLDLSVASPIQIVAARIPPKQSLEAALAYVDSKATQMEDHVKDYASRSTYYQGQQLRNLQLSDAFLMPDIAFFISHHFVQLESKIFKNGSLKGKRLDIAQQDILFRLGANGVEVKSEARAYSAAVPNHFYFDRPFLLYAKKRGSTTPFFVMWVANAELLCPHGSGP